ncbi:MAG TPA: AI-2E family transporter, partial [bacterium]|nr:AI-2E family transporter [bacterium]
MTQTAKPDSNTSRTRRLRFELAPMTLLIILLGIVGLWLLVKLLPVLCVLIMALFMVCALNSIVQFMNNHGVNRITAIALTFFAVLLIIALIVIVGIHPLSAELSVLGEQIPVIRSQLADQLSYLPFTSSLARWVRDGKYGTGSSNFGSLAASYSFHVLTFVTYALSGIFLAFYIMIERDRLRGGLFALVPRAHHVLLSRILLNLETIVGAYIRGQLLLSAMITIFTFLLLTLVGVENAIVFAVFAGMADVLPYLGVLLSVGPAVFATLPQGEPSIIIVLIAMLIYEELESRFLIPLVYGK